MKFSAFIRIGVLLLLLIVPVSIFAQDDDEEYYQSLLREEVENENMVYKPVIGFGYGYINFLGEVRNKNLNPLMGTPAYKVNVATFVDNDHYIRANFFFLFGQMAGNKVSVTEPSQNLNFKTDLTTFGVNLHYDFKPFIKTGSLLTPFISIGMESLQFNSKSDMYYSVNGEHFSYIYRPDGTIRDNTGNIMQRDNIFETDLRDQNLYGLGSYNQSAFAIPVDAGVDMAIADRITMRLGYSLNYTFTDNIDNVSSKATQGVRGDKMNDMFGYSYLTFHFDLFTSPKTLTVQNMFKDVEGIDYTLFDDSDLDIIPDMTDECPNTPSGVETDSIGCPFDTDKDGVPDFKDKELNTPAKTLVDDNGVQLNTEKFADEMVSRQAISRSEVESFLMMQRARTRYNIGKSSIPIPQRFKRIDKDKDDYISFDELLDAIDEFFDGSPDLKTPSDILELNDFFFAQ